jgi:hypothetical protein
MNEALKTIQFVIERQAQKQPEEAAPAPNGDASNSIHLGTPSTEATPGQQRQRFVETNRRPGAGIETIRTPPPVGGTTFTPEYPHMFVDWGSAGVNSMGNWSQWSGSAMPNMNFPKFDGTNPKLWKHRCETYFEYYAIPIERWVRLAVMNFEGSATYWVQSMESRIREMNWESLCVALETRFGRDQHNTLIRHFYHIRQTNSVPEYIENFDQLIHQLLAHENHLTSTMITTRFIDGLKDEIKSAVIIQRPADLDTACSLAMLQEDVWLHSGRREMRRTDFSNFIRSPAKPAPMPLPLPPVASHRTSNFGDRRGSV